MKLFLEKQLIKFLCTYYPHFIVQNFKIILKANLEYEDVPFLGSKWPSCPEQIFFGTNHYYCFYWPISFSLCKICKKFLQQIKSYQGVPFSGPKENVSDNLLISLVPFIHAYLQDKNQNQILIYYLNIDN